MCFSCFLSVLFFAWSVNMNVTAWPNHYKRWFCDSLAGAVQGYLPRSSTEILILQVSQNAPNKLYSYRIVSSGAMIWGGRSSLLLSSRCGSCWPEVFREDAANGTLGALAFAWPPPDPVPLRAVVSPWKVSLQFSRWPKNVALWTEKWHEVARNGFGTRGKTIYQNIWF